MTHLLPEASMFDSHTLSASPAHGSSSSGAASSHSHHGGGGGGSVYHASTSHHPGGLPVFTAGGPTFLGAGGAGMGGGLTPFALDMNNSFGQSSMASSRSMASQGTLQQLESHFAALRRLAAGQQLEDLDDFEFEAKALSHGASGRVRRCRRKNSGDPSFSRSSGSIALKEMYLRADNGAMDFVCREAHALVALSELHLAKTGRHPPPLLDYDNIVQIRGVAMKEGAFCVSMELMNGSLNAALGPCARMSESAAIFVAKGLLNALTVVHEAGLVHNDVKPANVLFFADDDQPATVKLCDFGSCDFLRYGHHATMQTGGSQHPGGGGQRQPSTSSSSETSGVTTHSRIAAATGALAFVGTNTCMSPERLRGGEYDGRADVWAVGLLLADITCGYRRPFAVELAEAMLRHTGGDVNTPPLSKDAVNGGNGPIGSLIDFSSVPSVSPASLAHTQGPPSGSIAGSGAVVPPASNESARFWLLLESVNRATEAGNWTAIVRDTLYAGCIAAANDPSAAHNPGGMVEPSLEFVELILACLTLEPRERPKAHDALQSPIFLIADEFQCSSEFRDWVLSAKHAADAAASE